MNAFMQRIMPSRIGTQIAVLVVTAIVVAHVAITTVIFFGHSHAPEPPFLEIESLVTTQRLIAAEPDETLRAAMLIAAQRAYPDLLVLSQAPAADNASPEDRFLPDLIGRVNGVGVFIANVPAGDASQQIAVARLADGRALAVPLRTPPRHPFLSPVVLGTLAFMASALILLSLWAARQLAAPLARVASAADRFTVTAHSPLLSEAGPVEVRRVAKALNDMQARVVTLIEDRTRMLAAVSHDLRTPITRLRLRAEDIDDVNRRAPILRDLSTMENLVQSALWFLRGELEPTPRVTTDLPPLVQTVCDDFSDAGHALRYDAPAHLYVRCAPEQLMRAIQNLIDNSLKFGGSVEVRVRSAGAEALIEVEDDGPGIPAVEKDRVLEPFYRGDAARSLNDGDSFGLGLSIARSIAVQNGGRLELVDAKPHGLIARIAVPLEV